MTSLDVTQINLVALIGGNLKRIAGTRGGEYAGPCPFCGGHDRLHVQPHASPRPMWRCRMCGDGRWHDAIDFIRQSDNIGFVEACKRLQLPIPSRHTRLPPLPPAPPDPVEPPSTIWQEAAKRFVFRSMGTLHNTDDAKTYLQQRGLILETYTNVLLGYNPGDYYVSRADFGLPPLYNDLGAEKLLWLPRGIVIPWFIGGDLWKVSIRRFQGDPKYYNLPGSANALYGADTVISGKPAVLTEGVFDALAIQQDAGDLVGAVATGSSGARSMRWLAKIAQASEVLASHDVDKTGEDAANYWLGILGAKAKRWQPLLKDPSEMLSAGLDVRLWVSAGLPAPAPAPAPPVTVAPIADPEFSIEGLRRHDGTEEWRLWDELTNLIVGVFPTEAEAEAAARTQIQDLASKAIA